MEILDVPDVVVVMGVMEMEQEPEELALSVGTEALELGIKVSKMSIPLLTENI